MMLLAISMVLFWCSPAIGIAYVIQKWLVRWHTNRPNNALADYGFATTSFMNISAILYLISNVFISIANN